MKILAWLLLVLFATSLLTYLFMPRLLFDLARGSLRRKGGVTLKQVTVGEFTWPYLEGGDPNGTPVVLIHGFGGDKDNWSFYAPYITQNYRLIAPDLPGFGENARRLDLSHAMAIQVERLAAFLDALGIDKCHLGGNSMGGFIALQFALAYPERLRSLTLFNNAGVLGTSESELQKLVEADAKASPLVPRTVSELEWLLGFIAHKPSYIPGRFKSVVFDTMKPHIPLLDQIFGELIEDFEQRPLNDRLGDVIVPTQIIWGRHDRLIDVSCAEIQHAGIKGSELVIFDDVGHVPMIEKPADTARHHLAFLAKH